MGKAEPMTAKAIGNRIKSRGLKKLRWYCEMCQKQCRDENGFKCHCMSEGHQRMMAVFAENAHKFLDSFSKEFEKTFVDLLKRRYGTRRVKANVVYNEFIHDRFHTHMNATIWPTLTAFVAHLGRTGQCVVDEDPEEGWHIRYIERDSDALRRQEEAKKREKMELNDEERIAKFIQEQIRRAQEASALKREAMMKMRKLQEQNAKKSNTEDCVAVSSRSVKEEEASDLANENNGEEDSYDDAYGYGYVDSDAEIEYDDESSKQFYIDERGEPKPIDLADIEPDKLSLTLNFAPQTVGSSIGNGSGTLGKVTNKLDNLFASSSSIATAPAKSTVVPSPSIPLVPKRDSIGVSAPTQLSTIHVVAKTLHPSTFSTSSIGTAPIKRKTSALDEIIAMNEKHKEREREKEKLKEKGLEMEREKVVKMARLDYWLMEGLIVKIINSKVGDGKYYKKKGLVTKVHDKYVADVKVMDLGDILRLDQAHLETVIPQLDSLVKIVNGSHRGEKAKLIALETEKFEAQVSLQSKYDSKSQIISLPYEDICKFEY